MPQELIPITYTDTKGQTQTTHIVRGRPQPRRLENFCRMVASGDHEPLDAYCHCYEKEANPETLPRLVATVTSMMGRSDVILRIQQLRTPVIPKIAQKYEYNLQKAMDECQTAWDLAFATGNVKAMIAIIELRAKLNKMLSEQIDVTHKHGFLDDAATAVLIQMKKQLEDMRATRKKDPKVINVTKEEE